MKKKVGTVLDEELILRAKKAAVSQGQALSQVLENALKMYLASLEPRVGPGGKTVSKATRGAMRISPADLRAVMEEEGVYEIE